MYLICPTAMDSTPQPVFTNIPKKKTETNITTVPGEIKKTILLCRLFLKKISIFFIKPSEY